MTNWTDIHPDFTDELQKEWEQLGLSPEEVKEWIGVGSKPEESGLVFHIKSENYEIDDVEQQDRLLDELREEFYGENKNKEEIDSPERDWTNINSNFTPELIQEWKNCGFNYGECFDWLSIVPVDQQSLALHDSAYYAWLRDLKKIDSEWFLNYGDSEELQMSTNNIYW